MAQDHSELYEKPGIISEYKKDNRTEQRLQIAGVLTLLETSQLPDLKADGNSAYDALSDLLRETNDAQFGIVSKLDENGQWVRDATSTIALEKRIPHDSPVIEANNALLRCLSRLRPIDFAIGKKHGEEGDKYRIDMKNKFQELTASILTIAQSDKPDDEKLEEIKKQEATFNTTLVNTLHNANLTKGCETKKEAEQLLLHYRNLSSLLEPARTMITLTYDEKARIFQRETQYPVTKKSDKQLEAMEELRKIQPNPFKAEKNAHNARPIALQEADSLFIDLMKDEKTALAAQARKTHLVGTKNAFIVKNELIPLVENQLVDDVINQKAIKENTLWLARTGVPVYVGKGENSKSVQLHTQENLNQIRDTASRIMSKEGVPITGKLKLHLTCLNTYSPQENQTTMVSNLYEATRKQKQGDDISYMPTNPHGTLCKLDVAPGLFAEGEYQPSGIALLQKATRLKSVTKVMLQAANTDNMLSVVNCASGQDRTGTAVEKTTQTWMEARYDVLGKTKENIETMRAQGGNAAEIAAHHVHGSPGMKTDSIANNAFGNERTFSEAASEQFYLDSAKTNKANKVKDVEFLKRPGSVAVDEFIKNRDAFQRSLDAYQKTIIEDKKKQQFYDMGRTLLTNIKGISGENPKSLDALSLAQLNTILTHGKTVLDNPDSKDPAVKESLVRLASSSHEVSGKTSPAWKALGSALITFACLALVVVGVLAAVPSGGSSMLLAAIGATGLSVGAAAGIGAAAIATTGVAGLGIYKAGSEKGMAKSVADFKTAFQSLPEIKDDTVEQEGEKPHI